MLRRIITELFLGLEPDMLHRLTFYRVEVVDVLNALHFHRAISCHHRDHFRRHILFTFLEHLFLSWKVIRTRNIRHLDLVRQPIFKNLERR